MANHLRRLPLERLRAEFTTQAEFVVIDQCVPNDVLKRLITRAHELRPQLHRNYIPGHKKGGSISAFHLDLAAFEFKALYASPPLLNTLETLTQKRLHVCPNSDPHAYALYYYTEEGDHVGYHYDTSYYQGERYTVLIGLIDKSSCRLECQLYKNDPIRETEVLSLDLPPGRLVLFNGDKLYHRVTALGAGEERVVLTLEYLTNTYINPTRRFVSNMKDAIAYFGFKQIFGRRAS
ncbi:MAG: 2OG-Fe(II) oxygenase [Gammaproteobacteria bacterium]|nr:2OG-Fe(II) oxygenase [Gammaproteobacteria bacterium]